MGRPERRQSFILIAVFVLLIAFAGRLVYIQGLDQEALAAEALKDRTTTATLYAQRGTITDGRGVVMATSVDRYDIVADQTLVKDFVQKDDNDKVVAKGPSGAAELLAPVLGLDVADLTAKLTGDKKYSLLAKNVTPDVRNRVRGLGITGIGDQYTTDRTYPLGKVAGNVVGFVGSDGTPLAGLELTQNDLLKGVNGKAEYERGKQGQAIPGGYSHTTPAVNGTNLQSTILSDVQWYAQQVVDQRASESGAQWATAVVLDNKTGNVLALADSGTGDPNNPGAGDVSSSRAVTNVFDPGSTAKIVTMAAALEEGIITPTSPYTVDYTYTTANGQTIKDSHQHGREQLTATGILAQSSNAGTTQIGQQLTKQQRYDYMSAFGFGSKTGIGLPGESKGILHPVKDWDGRTQYTVLFGQGVSVTAIQAAEVYATIGNGGVRMTPRLIDGTVDADGTAHPIEPAAGRRVVSEQTSSEALRMLESVVDTSDGTGGKASIPGYRVAGKTGTAQVPDDHGGLTATVSSFIGTVPADNPQITVAVIVYKPTIGYWGGGAIAAPDFSKIAGFTLNYLGIPPSTTPADPYPSTW